MYWPFSSKLGASKFWDNRSPNILEAYDNEYFQSKVANISALKNIRKYIDMVLNKQQLSTPGGKTPEKESVLKQLEQLEQKKSNHKTISTTLNREESL